MAVDVAQFETVEELQKFYSKKIRQADEADEADLRTEQSEATIKFYEHRAKQSELKAAKMEALEKFPLAKGFEDLVTGNDAAEILNAAKRVHERFEQIEKDKQTALDAAKAQQEQERAAAQTAYGAPAGGGGGAQPQTVSGAEENVRMVRERLQRGDGLQDNKMAVARFIQTRFREGVDAAQGPNSHYRNPGKETKVKDDRK